MRGRERDVETAGRETSARTEWKQEEKTQLKGSTRDLQGIYTPRPASRDGREQQQLDF